VKGTMQRARVLNEAMILTMAGSASYAQDQPTQEKKEEAKDAQAQWHAPPQELR
jgi:hypothetical protein